LESLLLRLIELFCGYLLVNSCFRCSV